VRILRSVLRSIADAAAVVCWGCEMLHTVDFSTCCNRMGFSVKMSEPLSGDGSFQYKAGPLPSQSQLTIVKLFTPRAAKELKVLKCSSDDPLVGKAIEAVRE